jgi:hypothetical protein
LKDIFDKYFKLGAAKEVNISHTARNALKACIESGDINPETFKKASKEVLNLMRDDSFKRFLESHFCTRLQRRLTTIDLKTWERPREIEQTLGLKDDSGSEGEEKEGGAPTLGVKKKPKTKKQILFNFSHKYFFFWGFLLNRNNWKTWGKY